jgi:hypothetical protein
MPGSLQATDLDFITRSEGPTLKAILPRLVISPSLGPRISTEEQHYLDWMIHGTATHAPRVFASPFWAPVFPSATMIPMVLQALLALSATHKRMILDPANSAREGLPPDAQEIFMLKQYCTGMRNLYAHLHERGTLSRSQLLLAVITCAIFVLVEATRGHYDAANIHAMSGTRLAQRLIDMGGGGDILDAHHVSFFARVKDQMTVFRQRHRSDDHVSPLTNDMAKVRFDSPVDAKQHLGAIVEISALAVEQVLTIQNPTAALRARRREDHAYYSSCFAAWYLAFKATIADKALSTTPEEALEWKALEQQYNSERASAERVLQMDLVN